MTDTHWLYTDVWMKGRCVRVWGFNSHKRAIDLLERFKQ